MTCILLLICWAHNHLSSQFVDLMHFIDANYSISIPIRLALLIEKNGLRLDTSGHCTYINRFLLHFINEHVQIMAIMRVIS